MHCLGKIADNNFEQNVFGNIVEACWQEIPAHFDNVQIDQFVMMPNHIHGILFLVGAQHAVPSYEQFQKPTQASLPTIIRSFKSATTKKINALRKSPGDLFWQRNYYEHVIRNEESYTHICEYIMTNPQNWLTDQNNPICLLEKEPHNKHENHYEN